MLDTSPTVSTSATAASPAGSYDIVIAGGGDANYDLAYGTPAGTLTVVSSPDPPEVNASDKGPNTVPNTVTITSQDPAGKGSREDRSVSETFESVGATHEAAGAAPAAGEAFVGVHQSLVDYFALQSQAPLARMFGLQLANSCFARDDGSRLTTSCE